jgi:hypothetical protein
MEGFRLELSELVVGYASTTCVTVPELGLNIASPAYVALMACILSRRDDVVYAAVPPESATEPSVVFPSKNVTISPSGIDPYIELPGVVFAVKVTG